MAALSLVIVLAGCGRPAAPPTTPEPTVAYTPPPPPSTTPTPLPPIMMRVFPDVDIAATGIGVNFVAETNVSPQVLPPDCSWEWDFGDASGKVTRTGGVNNTQWHPYAQNGRYLVNVVCLDGDKGVLASANSTITVDDALLLKACKTIEVSFLVYTMLRASGDDPPTTYMDGVYEDWAGVRFGNLVWDGNSFSASSSQTMGDGSQRFYKVTGAITTRPDGIELTVLNWEARCVSLVTEELRVFTLMGLALVNGGHTANVRGDFYAFAVGSGNVPAYVKQPFYEWRQLGSGPVTRKEFMGFDMERYQPKIEVRFRK